ncbi:MAG: VCBS repeat-containing protein [bacterium]
MTYWSRLTTSVLGISLVVTVVTTALAFSVIEPRSNQFFRPGGAIEVVWTGTNTLGTVDIALWRGTNLAMYLTSSVPSAATSMTWRTSLPTNLVSSSQYSISVAKSGVPGIGATSSCFVVVAPWIVWQLPAGSVAAWQANTNATRLSGFNISTQATSWQVRAANDLDGDGVSDVFWQLPATGQLVCWLMNTDGTTKSNVNVFSGTSTWQVVGAGDINRDGIADIVWQAPAGQLVCWFMNPDGTTRTNVNVSAVTSTWQVVGISDIDRDDVADIVLQLPSTGQVKCWFMNVNGSVKWSRDVSTNTTAWLVRSVADIDGDGIADMLWQLPGGEVACWFLNADATLRSTANVLTSPQSWILRAAGRNAGMWLSRGVTFYVSPTGRSRPDYTDWWNAATNIHDAIRVARAGDSVVVTDGTYEVSSTIIITNEVTVRSVNGPYATILNSPNLDRCIVLSASNAVVEGFTVRCGNAWQGRTTEITNTASGLIVATGDGASTILAGILPNRNIDPGSLKISGGGCSFVDNGDGTLSGSNGEEGLIQYETGELLLDFQITAPDAGIQFKADYQFVITSGRLADATHDVSNEGVGTGNGSSTVLSGFLANQHVKPGTFSVAGGGWLFVDNGDGSLTGTIGTDGIVDYVSGAWMLDFISTAPDSGTSFSASYQWVSTNIGSGVVMRDGTSLRNCRVTGFWADYGGGVSCTGSVTMADCEVFGNYAVYSGGGIQGSSGTVVSGGLISWNESGLSGGGTFGCLLENCIVQGNSSVGSGGGSCEGTVANCTVVGNISGTSGGGGTRNAQVINSVVWSNGPGSNSIGGTMLYSCAAVVPGGSGNITNPPGFVDYAGGNLRLSGSSMCINAGNNAMASGDGDIEGNTRIKAAVVDMGAYESPYAPIDASADHHGWISPSGRVGIVVGDRESFVIGPNPAHLLVNVKVDGAYIGPLTNYEFLNVTTGHTIVAYFSGNTDVGQYGFTQVGRSATGSSTLSWTMTNGWFYSVQQTPSLLPVAWSNVPALDGLYGLGSIVVTNAAAAQRMFYRIKATQAP